MSAEPKALRAKTAGFAGGVNLRDPIEQLAPDELSKCENVAFDQKGGLSKRLGCLSQGTFGAAGDRIISMYTFYRKPNPPQLIIQTSAGELYFTTDPSANPVVWTLITAAVSPTQAASYETANSNVWLCEGTVYASWDGVTYTTYPTAPLGVFLRMWKDTMWMSGIPGLPDRVYSSAPGDPTSWPAASWVDILHGDGDAITALASDGLFLICGKRRRVQVIFDPALFSNRTADFEKGIESHTGVVHVEDKLFYFSELGICRWLGDTSAQIISFKIDPLFRPDVINFGALFNVVGYTVGNRCGWAIPEVGSIVPTVVIEYYPRLGPLYQISGNIGPGPWTFHRIPVSTFTQFRSGGNEALYGGHNAANKLLQVFAPIGTDDGAVYPSTVRTGVYDLGDSVLTKYLRRLKVVGRGRFYLQLIRNFQTGAYQTFDINLPTSAKFWSTGGRWGDDTWGPDPNTLEQFVNCDAYGRVFSIAITDAGTDIGPQLMYVGSKGFYLDQGEWALYEVTFDGYLLGMR